MFFYIPPFFTIPRLALLNYPIKDYDRGRKNPRVYKDIPDTPICIHKKTLRRLSKKSLKLFKHFQIFLYCFITFCYNFITFLGKIYIKY